MARSVRKRCTRCSLWPSYVHQVAEDVRQLSGLLLKNYVRFGNRFLEASPELRDYVKSQVSHISLTHKMQNGHSTIYSRRAINVIGSRVLPSHHGREPALQYRLALFLTRPSACAVAPSLCVAGAACGARPRQLDGAQHGRYPHHHHRHQAHQGGTARAWHVSPAQFCVHSWLTCVHLDHGDDSTRCC